MNKTIKFLTLLAHKTWNRVIGRILDVNKLAILLHFLLYTAIYVSIMTGLLYLTFFGHPEGFITSNLFAIILIAVRCIFTLSFISLIVIGCEEALIRSVLSKKNPELFDTLFDMQKDLQNVLMGQLSITAVFAAVTPSIEQELNMSLLFCGIILFACILVTTLYDRLFLRAHVIEEILREMDQTEESDH